MRKIFNWSVVFLSLTLMTFFTVSELVGGSDVALAKAAKENKHSGKSIVMVDHQSGPKNFTKKFTKLFEEGMICVVDDEQLQILSEQFNLTVEEVSVDGEAVEVVKINGKKVHKGDIMDYLGTDNPDCQMVKSHKWYYLVFSGSVS